MGSPASAVRDGVGKEVGWSAVCVKESGREESKKCPERADIYNTLPPRFKQGALIAHFGTYTARLFSIKWNN